MATPESGKGGSVRLAATSVGEILDWTLDKDAVVDEFGTSESSGYQKAIAGRKRAQVTFNGKFDSAAVFPALEGASATLQLYLNATELYSIPAVIKSIQVKCDMNTGVANTISGVAVSHGAYTEPTLT